MKIYISVDMEGVSGVSAWEDVNSNSKTYERYRRQMNNEALAAIEGCIEAGAKEIVVKDAHATARNLFLEKLPAGVKVINGWSGCPKAMVQGLDDSFHGLIYVGYHSGAYSGGNPLSHTMNSRKFYEVKVNGERVSEFDLHSLIATNQNVPVLFLSGDTAICEHAQNKIPTLKTHATIEGIGNSSVSYSPSENLVHIKNGAIAAIGEINSAKLYEMPQSLQLSINFIDPKDAYRASFYPGAEMVDERTVVLKSKEILECMAFINFV